MRASRVSSLAGGFIRATGQTAQQDAEQGSALNETNRRNHAWNGFLQVTGDQRCGMGEE